MADIHAHHKALIAPFRSAFYDGDLAGLRREMDKLFASDCVFHMCHPFGDMTGPQAFFEAVIEPLFAALPDCERRDFIVMAGRTEHGGDWVGCGGNFMGVFAEPYLDIPPTGHMAHMRFHEFYQFENDKIVEMQAIWDIPELMMQAGAWPMVPSLGREWCIPGPASQDGLAIGVRDEAKSETSCQHIVEMLNFMKKHPSQGGAEVMEMPRFWHEKMSWYGPAGIGTGRGISGFRHWHQMPFLGGMPDRGAYVADITYHFFGDNDYAAVTGWPNMLQTLTHDGWLGLAPSNQKLEMRSLDFWRLENGKIRENWVTVDLLHVYDQLGVDVFKRMREFNKARYGMKAYSPLVSD